MEFGINKSLNNDFKGENRIYIGNRFLPEMLSLWGIEADVGIKTIKQLYEFIKPHVKGLRNEKEKKEKPIIWLGKMKS